MEVTHVGFLPENRNIRSAFEKRSYEHLSDARPVHPALYSNGSILTSKIAKVDNFGFDI